MKKNMSKLFGALVIGGAALAQAQTPTLTNLLDGESPPEVESEICQVALVQNDYNGTFQNTSSEPKQTTICIDDKTQEEIAIIVEDLKSQSCFSAFCGCWLG